ncbi:MAG: hypothetical protein ACXWU1_01535 [Allosphingosinicella sp.]
MFDESEREYHERRARAELDLAHRSESLRAVSAHVRLAALHMSRLRGTQTSARLVLAGRSPGHRGSSRATADLVEQNELKGEAVRVSR